MLGLVGLNAMVAQSSFTVDGLSSRIQQLQQETQAKRLEYAHLTAPDRIVAAAGRLGLQLPPPGAVQVIHVAGSAPKRGASGNATAGTGSAEDRG
jgi:cell division protein FtsL